MERLKSTLGILMWFVVSTVIAYHIGILDQNPMLGTQTFPCGWDHVVRWFPMPSNQITKSVENCMCILALYRSIQANMLIVILSSEPTMAAVDG